MKELDFREAIEPFVWNPEDYGSDSEKNCVRLDFEADDILEEEFMEIFDPVKLAALAHIFLQQQPALSAIIEIDDDSPSGHVFFAYSKDEEALKKFILGFRAMLDIELVKDVADKTHGIPRVHGFKEMFEKKLHGLKLAKIDL